MNYFRGLSKKSYFEKSKEIINVILRLPTGRQARELASG